MGKKQTRNATEGADRAAVHNWTTLSSAERQGLAGSPPIRVLVGEHHETLLRALRQLGIGTDAVIQVAMKDDGTIDVAALKIELEKNPDKPMRTANRTTSSHST